MMNETISAIYEKGILRPLTPLLLPEHTRVQIQIIAQSPDVQEERQRVRQILLSAGVIRSRPPVEPIRPVSEAQLAAAAAALGTAGPISELIIAEREGR
jgi:predicted DNA-binding antitoxin AbrB/MazE fold protein